MVSDTEILYSFDVVTVAPRFPPIFPGGPMEKLRPADQSGKTYNTQSVPRDGFIPFTSLRDFYGVGSAFVKILRVRRSQITFS